MSMYLIALALVVLVWLQAYCIRVNDRQIASLERLVEGQRHRIADLETVVALGQDCVDTLETDLAHADQRVAHLEHCVRLVVRGTPNAALGSKIPHLSDISLN